MVGGSGRFDTCHDPPRRCVTATAADLRPSSTLKNISTEPTASRSGEQMRVGVADHNFGRTTAMLRSAPDASLLLLDHADGGLLSHIGAHVRVPSRRAFHPTAPQPSIDSSSSHSERRWWRRRVAFAPRSAYSRPKGVMGQPLLEFSRFGFSLSLTFQYFVSSQHRTRRPLQHLEEG